MIALIHMAGAFAILCFVIMHVYMTTTGHTITAHVKAMITGWENVEEGEVQEWEKHGDRQPGESKA
jgi:cytochrome b subunit of formate dehydrogenase